MTLTIAVSSRALFDLESEHDLFETGDVRGFAQHVRANEEVLLSPGPAFELIRKLLALNSGVGQQGRDRVEVLLLSRYRPDESVRILRSVVHHGLDIGQAIFTAGADRLAYAQAQGAQLLLTLDAASAHRALSAGLAAAHLKPRVGTPAVHDREVRFAFDGDSVVFNEDPAGYAIIKEQGLRPWMAYEQAMAKVALPGGPYKTVLQAIGALQRQFVPVSCPVHVALVTARSVGASARALLTLRAWGVSLDHAVFASGAPKGPLLRAYGADLFVDDTPAHVECAHRLHVPAGHVAPDAYVFERG